MMTSTDRNPTLRRILALVMCVVVAVFFTALLIHSHSGGASDHAAHCQVCALGHTTASIASVITLAIALQMLMMLRASAPSRGSPRLVVVHTTRPPPFRR